MLEVRADHNRHVVCVFNRGPKVTYFVGIEGPQLSVCQADHDAFERLYSHIPKKTVAGTEVEYSPLDFAMAYMRDPAARAMIPIGPSALRVLMAIMRGQSTEGVADETLNQLENIMAKAETTEAGFRKPDGPVAKVHKYLDGRLEAIKAGTVSRKELIDALEAKEISRATATTQAGAWARLNGVTFARPTEAKEAKAAKRKGAK